MGSNSSNTANESDNVKKSNPQQQPNWNQPPNSSSANQSSNYQSQQQPNWQKPPGNYSSSSQQQSNPINKEDIINGFVNCGYSRSEAERIVRNYGTEEAFKKLCVEGIEVLKKSGNLSDGEAKRLMMDKGLLGALNESQKKLPPPSQS